MKHVNEAHCPSCENKLKDAHKQIIRLVKAVRKRDPSHHASCIRRGKEEQDRAFALKRSQLKYPNSKHNWDPAEAVDLFKQLPDGTYWLNKDDMIAIHQHLLKEGIVHDFGGNWVTFKDYAHFETKE